MQIIVVSKHLSAARTLHIMPRHWAFLAGSLLLAISLAATALTWLSVRWQFSFAQDLVSSVYQRENRQAREALDRHLGSMAERLGQLQAQVWQLDSTSERIASQTGVRRETMSARASGKGGPFVPAALSTEQLAGEIEKLTRTVEGQSDDFAQYAAHLLEKRVRERLLPTTPPVQGGALGSGFGRRADPINGAQALHEGLDFNAEIGTPVVAAATGVVLTSEYHNEFGNMIDIDHGQGLISRYAHLSKSHVQPGQFVQRGSMIGAVGNSGRSTGPHLHFEVRQNGIAQNPSTFLRQNRTLAQARRNQNPDTP